MTWYGTVLLVLAALGAVYAFLLWPRCPRRSLGALAGWDYAHRGLWNAQRPENSLPAFPLRWRLAMALSWTCT